MTRKWHRFRVSIMAFLGSLLLSIALASPSYSHWADLSVAEVIVGRSTETQMTLTFPTGLVAFADDNKDNQLSVDEVRQHNSALQSFLGERIRFSDRSNQIATLKVLPSDLTTLPSSLKVSGNTHSILLLNYTWQKPVEGLRIRYNFFLPNVPTATCLTTILNKGELQNFTFSPTNQNFPHSDFAWLSGGNLFLAIAGAFVWGAMHALSPGHGKTVVGAYLAGAHATVQQALILGLTTTITHTIGVFSLGLVALFAYQFILPEQIYPWLNFLSGLMVLLIGFNLFMKRSQNLPFFKKFSRSQNQSVGHHDHEHTHDHNHSHTHDHHAHEHHEHDHGHNHDHSHTHIPVDGAAVNMRSLIALGVSGGLLPCPAALVLMLSAISLGQVSLGLGLVLSFSLGLAAVLTSLGLLLISAKHLFEKMPNKVNLMQGLPILSALCITLVGLGITVQALLQIGQVKI